MIETIFSSLWESISKNLMTHNFLVFDLFVGTFQKCVSNFVFISYQNTYLALKLKKCTGYFYLTKIDDFSG